MFYIHCFQTLIHSTNTWKFQQCIGICLFGSQIWKPSIHFFTSLVEFYFQFIHIESIPLSTTMAATIYQRCQNTPKRHPTKACHEVLQRQGPHS